MNWFPVLNILIMEDMFVDPIMHKSLVISLRKW
jgi:hypothetical protein